VKVADGALAEVDALNPDRRLAVLSPIADAGGIGKIIGVNFDQHDAPAEHLLGHVVEQAPPDVQLLDVEPVQRGQVGGRRLEKQPLIALEVQAHGEGEQRVRIVAQRMHDLDP
jgi:hypothetical protein